MNPNPSLDFTCVAKPNFVLLTLFIATKKKRTYHISHRKYHIKTQYETALKGALKTVNLQKKFWKCWSLLYL